MQAIVKVMQTVMRTARLEGRNLRVRGPVLDDKEGVDVAIGLAMAHRFQLDSVLYAEQSEKENLRITVFMRNGNALIPLHHSPKGEVVYGFVNVDNVPVKFVQLQSRGPHIDFSERGMFSGNPYIVLRGCLIDNYVHSAFPVVLLENCKIGSAIVAPNVFSDGTSFVSNQQLSQNLSPSLAAEIQTLKPLEY